MNWSFEDSRVFIYLNFIETSGFRWKLADSISEKLSASEELSQWRKSLLSAALLWLSAVYKEQKDPQSHHEETMLTRLKSLLVSQDGHLTSLHGWTTGFNYSCGCKQYFSLSHSFLIAMCPYSSNDTEFSRLRWDESWKMLVIHLLIVQEHYLPTIVSIIVVLLKNINVCLLDKLLQTEGQVRIYDIIFKHAY